MRAYFFGNMYLSSIQQGIQAAHAISNMFVKYQLDSSQRVKLLYEWASDHKTVVLLNGGFSDNIRGVVQLFENIENPYPWAEFHEGKDALDGALTNVGIILPEKIYEAARLVRTYRKPYGNVLTPKQTIWEEGELVIRPDNEWGVNTDETITWSFTKWEAQLIDKLNEFGLAH